MVSIRRTGSNIHHICIPSGAVVDTGENTTPNKEIITQRQANNVFLLGSSQLSPVQSSRQ